MCPVLPYLKVNKYNLRLKVEICPTDDSRTTSVRLMKCQSYTDHLASFGRPYIKAAFYSTILEEPICKTSKSSGSTEN